MDRSDSSDWKKELAKVLSVGVAALVCLMWIVNDPSLSSFIFSVVVIASISWMCERKTVVERYPLKNRAVLITGCDSGFGHELALSLSEQGAVVFAGCLNSNGEGAKILISKRPPTRMHVLQMDVTDMDDITDVKEHIECVIGEKEGLWGLVNNAGLNFLGDIELSTLDQFEKVNDVNYLGLVRVTKTFIPLVRKAKGRIVNVTSVKGLFSEPFNAAYGSTKYAGEAFTDILRMEMKKFGVSVSAIEPCNFGGATKCIEFSRIKSDFETMWTNITKDQQELYGREYIDAHLQNIQDAVPTASFDTHLVTEAIEDALYNMKPKTRYLIPGGAGWIEWYRWKTYLKPFLPDWLMDKWILRDTRHFPQLKGLNSQANTS